MLEINLGSNGIIRRKINPTLFLQNPDIAYEITFTIINENKVLENTDDL